MRTSPLPLIFATTLVAIMGNTIVAPVIPDILSDLRVGEAGAGILIGSIALPGIVMAPLVGVLADRLGRRAVLVPCLLLFGVTGLAMAAAPTFAWLIGARLVQGIGAAGLINLAITIIGDHWDGARRTELIGRNAVMLTVGLAIFPLIGGALGEWWSWRVALGAQGIGIFVGAWAFLVLDQGQRLRDVSLREQLGGLGEAVRCPVVLEVLLSSLLAFVLIYGVFLSVLPVHLEGAFGLGPAMRGVVMALPAVTASVVAFNLGHLSRTVGQPVLLVGACVLMATSFATMGLVAAAPVAAVACAVYGFGDGALLPTLQDRAITEAPDAHRGGVLAAWVSSVRLGQTIGPLLAAGALARFSTSTALLLGGTVALGLGLPWQWVRSFVATPALGRRCEDARGLDRCDVPDSGHRRRMGG